MLGRAFRAESRAIVRFFHPSQHQTADAERGFLSVDLFHRKQLFGVLVAKFSSQPVSAVRNRSNAAPFAVTDLENRIYQVLSDTVSFTLDDARILVLHFGHAA